MPENHRNRLKSLSDITLGIKTDANKPIAIHNQNEVTPLAQDPELFGKAKKPNCTSMGAEGTVIRTEIR